MSNQPETFEKYSIRIHDYSPNAFCLIRVELDEQGHPEDWTFLYCNDALARLEGKSKEELIGKRFFDIFPGGNRKWLKYYYKAAYEGEPTSFEELSEEIDQYLHIDACPAGEPGVCSCTISDIKKDVYDKRQNEKQIAESQSLLEALTADYLNVYVVEPGTDCGTILKLEGYVTNGIKELPKKFSYSKVLHTYANDRVCDEDRNEFLETALPEALLESFAGGRERLEFHYRVPVDGNLEHYSGLYIRISKEGEQLKLIAGFRNIENVISLQDKTRREGLYSAYAAVSDLYLAMFRVNIKENTYTSIKTTDAVQKYTLPGSKRYDENLNAIITGLADADSLAPALEFLDVNTIADRMQEKRHLAMNFNGKVAGACKLHLIKDDEDAEGALWHVILAVEVLEETEFHSVVDILTESYWNVYWLNLAKDTAKVLKYMDGLDNAHLKSGQSLSYTKTLQGWIKNRVYKEDQDRLLKAMDIDSVRSELQKQRRYTGNYRRIIDGRLQNFQFVYTREENSEYALVAFQNIDSILEEHEAQAKRDLEHREALTQALAAAEQANKAKTTFLNSMSHDIRTPMNAIIGFTALAQKHLDDPAQVQDYLGKISTSGAHLLSLINDILDMSRIESGTVKLEEKAVHIPDVLDDLRIMVQGLSNSKNQNLFIDTQDVVHENVFTDPLRLNQVLLNIVSNAVKFTQPGGDITIRLVEKPCSQKHYAAYEFSVKDNGIGMSQEFQKHIFETFAREYSATVSGIQGTGLGMAITKNIVDMMGGDIRVESEEGKGSLFTVTLNFRLADDEVKSGPIPESGESSAQPAGSDENVREDKDEKQRDYSDKHVLLVEDNELNREIATAILEETGMTIDSVEDGDEAVAAINREPAGKYDLILMDIQMPRMDGYTATREIRTLSDNRKANIPIVAMTANAFEEDKRKAFEAGMNGHIIKPISIEAIAKVLDEVFAGKR